MGPKRRRLAQRCGYVVIVGLLAVIISDLVAIAVYQPHNPISETISALAHGPFGWIQDLGLYALASAAVACAIGVVQRFPGDGRVKNGGVLLTLLAVVIVAIAGINQDLRVAVPASNLHLVCVLALYVLVVGASVLLARPLGEASHGWRRFNIGFGIAWSALAPVFFVLPTSIDGAYERLLGLMLIGWLASMSWLLIRSESRGTIPMVG